MAIPNNSKILEGFPFEEVARIPAPGMAAPSDLNFSPDDRIVTFLYSPEMTLVNQLYAYDIETGERTILVQASELDAAEEGYSLAEALRRERMRQLSLGVTHYAWADLGSRIILSLQGGIYGKELPVGPLRKIVDQSIGQILAPQLSPDGQWIGFVLNSELYVAPFAGGEPRPVTTGARETGRTHGLAEYIAEEEMGRHQGFWWSPDSQWIAFCEVDETHIPPYRIVHQGVDFDGEIVQEDHTYPFAGQPNAHVRLGVISVRGGKPTWMDLGSDPDSYLARVNWFPDGSLVVQVENRPQTRLDLLKLDTRTGKARPLLTETSETWINLHDLLVPLKKQDGFIWASERTGFRHLYLFDAEGNLVRPLTQGEWMVDSLAGVDEEKGLVYYTASADSPLECHLYAVGLDGGTPRRITAEPGIHTVVIDHACKRFLDLYSNLYHPPSLTLRSLASVSQEVSILAENDPRIEATRISAPEIVALDNRKGDRLYGAIFRPPERFGLGPYPTIVYVYGGPHVQLVANDWKLTAAMRPQYLRQLGYLVFVLDNRGSARRGLAFEGTIKSKLGHPEVEDQVDGVRWLVQKGLADPQRVAVYGWSYGGYMAAMCLATAPETFKAAVCGAPVTDWDGYDTHYTERYMGLPQENEAAYFESSVLTQAGKMKGKLMLVHGLIDENVHFRHTARLINILIRARKPYDLLVFPDERHSPRRLEERVYMEENIRDFFLRNV
jgi:dipeptidyl-peptidase-4